MPIIGADCLVPEGTVLEDGAVLGPRVTLAGPGIAILAGARVEAAATIGEDVRIGKNAWVRAGAVVLSDVPANAIVEGNPAQVVGYRKAASRDRPDPQHIDLARFDAMERPAMIPLEVGGGALYLMRKVTDPRGSLTVGEVPGELPFTPMRYFAVYDVPSIELRGEHAHRRCEQFLICLAGSVRVLLDDGVSRCEVTLDRPDAGVHMPPMIWGTQYRYSPDAVLLVFASRGYENEDYIRDYDTFLAEAKGSRA